LDSDGTNLGESGESKVSIVKECMEKIAKNFDDSNTQITSLIKQKCSLCQNEFYFLREYEKKEKDSARYCSICFSTVKNSKVAISRLDQLQKGEILLTSYLALLQHLPVSL
jgi:hypothetical protein